MSERIVLRCTCGGEVGLVRLNPETLALEHRQNPRNNRHMVRLARSEQESASVVHGAGDALARSEAADTRLRGRVVVPAASIQTTNGMRPASNGRSGSRVSPSRNSKSAGRAC